MSRFLLPPLLFALAACGQDRPERPDDEANERLDSIEQRLDAAEAADPVPVRPDDEAFTAPKEEGPVAAEATDPSE